MFKTVSSLLYLNKNIKSLSLFLLNWSLTFNTFLFFIILVEKNLKRIHIAYFEKCLNVKIGR